MILEEDQIVIRPSLKPRQGWSEAFEAMNVNGDDKLLIQDVFEDEGASLRNTFTDMNYLMRDPSGHLKTN